MSLLGHLTIVKQVTCIHLSYRWFVYTVMSLLVHLTIVKQVTCIHLSYRCFVYTCHVLIRPYDDSQTGDLYTPVMSRWFVYTCHVQVIRTHLSCPYLATWQQSKSLYFTTVL